MVGAGPAGWQRPPPHAGRRHDAAVASALAALASGAPPLAPLLGLVRRLAALGRRSAAAR